MSKRYLILIALAAAAGIALSLYTAYDYYQLINGLKNGPSYCNINRYLNCDAATLSPYSHFGGLPNGFYGAIYFSLLLLLALALLASDDEWREEAGELLLGLTLIGGLNCLVFLTLLLVKIQSLCLNCLGIYLLAGLCLWGARRIAKTSWLMALPQAFLSGLRLFTFSGRTASGRALTLAGLVLAASLGFNYWSLAQRWGGSEATALRPASDFLSAQTVEIDSGDSPGWGAAQPQLTIVEWSDFRCPYCQKSAEVLASVLSSYRDQVRLIFKNFPLDLECNPLLKQRMHDGACQAAYASLCADEQGRFWPYHDLLFRYNQEFDRETLRAHARVAGLDLKKFNDCLDSPRPRQRVSQDIRQALALEIHSTPSFFFDGRRYSGPLSASTLQEILNRQLENRAR